MILFYSFNAKYTQSANYDFNFIMILFYYEAFGTINTTERGFQFHYDLILFLGPIGSAIAGALFQFHYDLILLYTRNYSY